MDEWFEKTCGTDTIAFVEFIDRYHLLLLVQAKHNKTLKITLKNYALKNIKLYCNIGLCFRSIMAVALPVGG